MNISTFANKKILWVSWKDITNPAAGGAEVVTANLAKRMAKEGAEVKLLVAGYAGCTDTGKIDGYEIIRVGSRWSVYWKSYFYYKKYLADWPNIIIEEINTVPFLTRWYSEQKSILFIHQLCRKVWFYQMAFPLSLLGYFLEPILLRLVNSLPVITVSESTRADLVRMGFNEHKVAIIHEGIEVPPLSSLPPKKGVPIILSVGSIRPMKRTLEIVKAFEIAKKNQKQLELHIAGEAKGRYGERILKVINRSPYAKDIVFYGKVSETKKIELMRMAHILCVTSVKEGWGLTVTEANSQGTVAIVYDADGLRDSVRNNLTGLVCSENSPSGLAERIEFLINDQLMYESLRQNAWRWSKEINFENAYADFKMSVANFS